MSYRFVGWIVGATAAFVAGLACATTTPADPLNSPGWPSMQARFFKDVPLQFDPRVLVHAPKSAEDALAVPVLVEAPGLPGVQEVVVIADLNPIQKVLSLSTPAAAPSVSFRFKVEQSTPIRAAMRTADGVWHVGGVWLSAAGGGCTTPSGGSRGLWRGEVGQMSGRLWRGTEPGTQRVKLRVIHPMDTGLAGAIPAFYLDRLTLRDPTGKELATLHAFEPVSENPVFTFDVHGSGPVQVDGHDIQGDRFTGEIKP